MNFFNEAVQYDVMRNLNKAITNYRKSIETDENILDAYINLSFILWMLYLEPPDRELYDVQIEFWQNLYITDVYDLLQQAIAIFPNRKEPVFWQKYYESFEDSTAFSVEQAKRFVEQDPACLVPYFFIILYERSEENIKKAKELYADISECNTVKNNYIMGMLKCKI